MKNQDKNMMPQIIIIKIMKNQVTFLGKERRISQDLINLMLKILINFLMISMNYLRKSQEKRRKNLVVRMI